MGQDFGTLEYYERVRLGTGGESLSGPTWKPLLALLDAVGVDRTECFFTNALLGLRATPPMTGPSPGWTDRDLVEASLQMLAHQIESLEPKVVLTLGLPAARALGRLAPDTLARWQSAVRWADVDVAGPAHLDVKELTHGGGAPSIGALVHPSYRGRNVRLRSFNEKHGEDAERDILHRVLG